MTVAAVDYGTDIEHLYDLGLRWGLVSGQANLAMAIVRRLSTTRGTLYYDLSYGFNLLEALNQSFTVTSLAALRSQIVAEVLKDQRVDTCRASVQTGQDTLTVVLEIVSADGPFDLVLGINALSVDVLNAGQAGAPAGLAVPTVEASFSGPPGIPGPPGVGVQGPQGIPGPAGNASQSFSASDEQADDSGVEKVWWQFAFDASSLPAGALAADFNLLASSAAGNATFRLYVGGAFVNVGDAPGGGVLIDSATRNGASFLPIKLDGPFTNPTGVVPVQITIQSSAVGQDARMKNMSGSVTG